MRVSSLPRFYISIVKTHLSARNQIYKMAQFRIHFSV